MVWGYRWDGVAYGHDMLVAVAKADPRLLLLTQETDINYTVSGIGYHPASRSNLLLYYDLESVKTNSGIGFKFDEPNPGLKQERVPEEPLQEIITAIEEGLETGIIYHPFNYTNYGYACYDYDHWSCLTPDAKWRSGWYFMGYWSYWVKNDVEQKFSYSGLGSSIRELVNGSWDGWGFQVGLEGRGGSNPREPFVAVLPLITLNEQHVTFEPGEQIQLLATLHPGKITGKKISWNSSHPEIVCVDENGLLTGVSSGIATITAFISDEDIETGSCVVNCVDVPVTEIYITPETAEMIYGEELQLEVTFIPENATNKNIKFWATSNAEIATVDENGMVRATGSGAVVITAVTEDGEKTATSRINCMVPVTGISVSPPEIEMEVEETFRLKIVVSPENATNRELTCISSHPEIVEVDNQGALKAISKGEAVITVTTIDGAYSAECVVIVKEDTHVEEATISSLPGVYPTTTRGLITVYTQQPTLVTLTDVSGKILLATLTDSPETELSLGAYPHGIYFLILENQITKIIKN